MSSGNLGRLLRYEYYPPKSHSSKYIRWRILVEVYSEPDKEGRQSFATYTTHPDGTVSHAVFYSHLKGMIRQLRHNIANRFWFNRMRIRLAGPYLKDPGYLVWLERHGLEIPQ